MTTKTQPEEDNEPSSIVLTALRSWVKDFEQELSKKDLEKEMEEAYKINIQKYLFQGEPNFSKSKYEEA